MKKYLFTLLCLTGVMLFSACSSEDDLAAVPGLTDEEKAAIIAEASQDSDVPILLNVGSQMDANRGVTRAPLESDPTTKLFTTDGTDNYLGVFCLAQKKMPTASEVAVDNITWDGNTPLGSLDPNMKASVSLLEEKDEGLGEDPNVIGTVRTFDAVSEIRFWEGNDRKVLYYPTASWYNYYFYAYYPRVENTAQTTVVRNNASTVTVDYTLNGTQDIIWGKAVPTTETTAADPLSDIDRGFNAKYFRDKAENHGGLNTIDELPKLGLTHCLTQLRFYIKSSDSYWDQYVTQEGNPLKLKSIQVINMPNAWRLTVADKAAVNNQEGKFSYIGNANSVSTINVKKLAVNGFGYSVADAHNDEDRFDPNDDQTFMDITQAYQYVGYVMVPTTDMYNEVHNTYSDIATTPQLKIKLVVGDDSDVDLGELILSLPKVGDDVDKYRAGKVYNIRLDLAIPRPRAGSAELNSWEVEEDVDAQSDLNVDLPIGNE